MPFVKTDTGIYVNERYIRLFSSCMKPRPLQIKCGVSSHFVCHFYKFFQTTKKYGMLLSDRSCKILRLIHVLGVLDSFCLCCFSLWETKNLKDMLPFNFMFYCFYTERVHDTSFLLSLWTHSHRKVCCHKFHPQNLQGTLVLEKKFYRPLLNFNSCGHADRFILYQHVYM